MASRPVTSAFSCLQCRTSVLRAFTSTASPAATALQSPRRIGRTIQRSDFAQPRQYITTNTTTKRPAVDEVKEDKEDGQDSQAVPQKTVDSTAESPSENKEGDTPWYLQVEAPLHAPIDHAASLPDIPEGSPPLVEPLVKFVYEEMGLDDLNLLDLRSLDPPPALGPNLLMLFGTARSERHLHVSSSRLVKWLRNEHRVEASADGLISPGDLRTKLRRLRRKAKLLGTNAVVTGGDDGITTGWICVNLGTIDLHSDEAAHFDDDGRMSGFGAPVLGTTIVIQVMTESRRAELNLEELWSKQLRKSKEVEEIRLQSEQREFHRKFGKLFNTSKPKTSASSPARSQQTRFFSTSGTVRRPLAPLTARTQPIESEAGVQPEAAPEPGTSTTFDEARTRIREIQLGGADSTPEEATALLSAIFRSSPRDQDLPPTHAALAVSLLQTMHERGLPLLTHDTLVTIIEALLTSGAHGPRATQVQTNLEHLLTRAVPAPPPDTALLRLLDAYFRRNDSDRFWRLAWRLRPQRAAPRGPVLYEYVLRRAASTANPAWCADALRVCVPEMPNEDPPVRPVGAVWDALRACLRVADPGAEELASATSAAVARNPEDPELKRRANGEFVRMYRQLNAWRKQTIGV
ncbi:hypothetical protein SODALDRAFT_326396 [Sodiomyces alkalinus F11]|uniref:ATPase synthesis protein 25 n=1 Tax=Sodiomyces alkalinus (strain CBS 110278 / VKM F-3762 / F11) TaxID=1314773 RepID=A0A3N2Q623_SODAK|nr:hypothetical protein SODALDRAFT_326396 [Sodiomyces alkalinus F11]ROT42221.1 hypothetical protein SODALDRAFT_326396 [Sodiomyces alkalinus F11]